MITLYIGEQRCGRIKATTDKDCLSPDIIRFSERLMADMSIEEQKQYLMSWAKAYEQRNFKVCIDTEFLFYETEG